MFAGIHAVLYAMFDEGEGIDSGAMARQIEYCVESGCRGIAILGLATEAQKLTPGERIALIEAAAEALNGRLPFCVTLSGNSVGEQVELLRAAERSRADWLIAQPPMAGSYGAEAYLDFFERVAAETNLPFAVQNAPAYLGRSLSAEDVRRLRDRLPNLAAVKSEDSALGVRAIIDAVDGQLAVLGGRGGLELIDSLRLGCAGFVLAPDIAPVAVRICEAWQDGDARKAEGLYARAAPSIMFSMQSLEHLIAYGKRIFAENCGLPVHDRAPALAPTQAGLDIAARHAAALKAILSGS